MTRIRAEQLYLGAMIVFSKSKPKSDLYVNDFLVFPHRYLYISVYHLRDGVHGAPDILKFMEEQINQAPGQQWGQLTKEMLPKMATYVVKIAQDFLPYWDTHKANWAPCQSEILDKIKSERGRKATKFELIAKVNFQKHWKTPNGGEEWIQKLQSELFEQEQASMISGKKG